MPEPDTTASTAHGNDRTISTPDGNLYVREVPGEGPAVILLHGYPDDHTIYDRLSPLLAPHRTVAVDFLGYGRSDRGDSIGVSLTDHGRQIRAVIDQLDIDQMVLVGHDGSGPDAVAFAVDDPGRVQHVVLLNTMFGNLPSLRMPEMTRLFADAQLTTLADDLTGDPAQLLWLLQRWGRQWDLDQEPDGIAMKAIVPQFFGNEEHFTALAAIRTWTADLHPSLARQDELIAQGALRDLHVPVTLAFGADDRYLDAQLAKDLHHLFGTATLELIARAGHYPQHDQPHAVAAIIHRALGA